MGAREFRGDDEGYLAWIAGNPGGYVINIGRSLATSDARLHHARCRTIGGVNPRGGAWTGPYIKVCAVDVRDLDRWTCENVGGPITRCGICRPANEIAPDIGKPVVTDDPTQHHDPVAPLGLYFDLSETSDRLTAVTARAGDYVPFERLSTAQQQLRDGLRMHIRQLQAMPGEILHATFAGRKPARADVENLLLYNIDSGGGSFAAAARFGLRFELAPRPPEVEGSYGYRYELASRDDDLQHWRAVRELASWDWVDLGVFAGVKKLEQVWLALSCAAVRIGSPVRNPDTPFSLRVRIRPPRGKAPALAALLKGVFDGVICSLQSHGDPASAGDLAERVAANLPATGRQVKALLLEPERAVLGTVPRLLHPRGPGVAWSPADDLCLAGELLAEPPVGEGWSISGEVREIAPA